ncbi:MAG TPA: serine/threonine-protein kinase [Patescibacteria group bacterium]|nr:serine/threonine-protein kinase [Patescibacteria group bacterium]
MQSERWQQIRRIFEQAVELDDDARMRVLDAACGGDAELRREVESLLDADAGAAGDRTSLGSAAPELLKSLHDEDDRAQRDAWQGRRVGAWRLLREIGRGGMGAVWLAERDDGAYRQQAAVKLMRPGWRDDELMRRFRAERQILAALNHPNIARLIDGGMVDESPFLVLEYVDGEPIERWCEQHALELDARLRLMLDVCDAVAHAHRRLVVHRDLKPSNILVDRDGQVKLLDFGIAKLLESDGSREISAVRMFTPDYAAPEQVRGDVVTTGVDVHALGLLLCQLLTGRRPYGQTASTPAAYEQAILTQEPEAPSRIVTQRQTGSIAPVGSLDVARLQRRLRGDLDAIVLKALRKRPEDRYASVEALAADLRRFLARQPVEARRGRWRYRATRFLQRHALSTSLALITLLSLFGGLAAALWQADVARGERDQARREALKSTHALEFMTSVFEIADPNANLGRAVTAIELLKRGAETLPLQLDDEPDVRAAMFGVLGDAQLGLGEAKIAHDLHTQGLAEARRSEDPVAIGEALLALGAATTRLGDIAASESLAKEAAALALPLGERGDAVRARTDLRLANQALSRSEYEVAEPLFRRGMATFERLNGHPDPEAAIPFSSLLHATGRADEAEPVLRAALAQIERETPPIHPGRAALSAQLATNYTRRGLPEQAEPLLREALRVKLAIYGSDHPSVDTTRHNLARILADLGRWDEAEAIDRAVLAAHRRRHGTHHPSIAASEAGLARVLLDSDRAAEAEPLWRSAQATARDKFGELDAAVGITALGLGRTLLALARFDEADAQLALAERVYTRLGDNGTSSLARVRLERTRLALQRSDAPVDCTDAAAGLATATRTDATRGYALAVLAACQHRGGDMAKAMTTLADALQVLRTHRGERFPERRYAEALAATWR